MAVTIGVSGVTFNDGTIQTSGVNTTDYGSSSITPSTGVTATFPAAGWKRIELTTYGPISGGTSVNISQMYFYDNSGSFAGGSIRMVGGVNGGNINAQATVSQRTYSGSAGSMVTPINGTTAGWQTSSWILQRVSSSAIHIFGTVHSNTFASFYTGWYSGQNPISSCKYTFTKSTADSMYIRMRSFN